MPKVSVIVPVYNTEKYLIACMDSILCQTLEDIEVICVDDGSSDASASILDTYARRDVRVQVIHKENQGYGHSLNTGVNLATGDYIGIVESDDCILPEMYEILYNLAYVNDLDIVKSDIFYWWEEMDYIHKAHRDNLENYYNRVLEEEDRVVFFSFYMNTWTGIYRRTFLEKNHIYHNESPGASYQDNGFWIQTMSMCRRAMWVDKAFYKYRQDNPSASIKSSSKIWAMSDEYDYVTEMLKERKLCREAEIANYYRLVRNKGTFLRIADEHKREFCNRIVSDYKKYRDYIWINAGINGWYQKVCEDPDKFCSSFIGKKEKILRRLQSTEKIYIYGAGKQGERALRILCNNSFSEKICGFVVSGNIEREYVGIVPVFNKTILKEPKGNAFIIIAVSKATKGYWQIKEYVEENGLAAIDISELSEYFYMQV